MSTAPDQVAKTTTIQSLKTVSNDAQLPEISAGFNSSRSFELLQRAAKALGASTLVPDIYRGNLSNCIIALEMAQRIGASPLMVMQNLYIVYARPAWSAKFLIACFNQCGRFSAVRYIWSGTRGKDDWGCQAWSIEKETGEKILGPVITLQLAKDEGWYGRKDSKWKTIPEKMFMYRAAAWMIDTHAPELSMGIRTEDEEHDTYDATRGADGKYSVTTESLRDAQDVIESAATAPAPAEPDAIPHYDEVAALKALKEAGDLKTLSDAWADIVSDFDDTNRDIPPSVDEAFKDCKAKLQKL